MKRQRTEITEVDTGTYRFHITVSHGTHRKADGISVGRSSAMYKWVLARLHESGRDVPPVWHYDTSRVNYPFGNSTIIKMIREDQ